MMMQKGLPIFNYDRHEVRVGVVHRSRADNGSLSTTKLETAAADNSQLSNSEASMRTISCASGHELSFTWPAEPHIWLIVLVNVMVTYPQ